MEFDFQSGGPNPIAALEVVLTDGRHVATSHDHSGVPASDIDEQGGRLVEKFISLAEPVLGGTKTQDLIGKIGSLEKLSDLRAMMRLCAA